MLFVQMSQDKASLIDATSTGAIIDRSKTAVENMINLDPMTADTLLENIRVRYSGNLIYTYTGSILVAVNPFQVLPIYTPQIVRSYFGVKLGEKEPHVFAIADAAFALLMEEKRNQSLIISGESGAGKTENTKLILQYLAMRTQSQGIAGGGQSVEQKILQASPVMEAFGNARTVRNNNSSRFGKFIEILFNNSMQIDGAVIEQYLLEKSRIVKQGEGERNYHIFYELCFSEDKEMVQSLSLDHPSTFHYTSQSGIYELGEHDPPDAKTFNKVREAMTFLGFTPGEQEALFRNTAAVLHLGNLEFAPGANESSTVSNRDRLHIVAELLSVPSAKLEEALTIRYNEIRGERIKVPLKPEQASDARDAMAKALYGNQFSWLVERINASIMGSKPVPTNPVFIGVLDIFGFENFKENSFEQLCINFANEKLQQQFNTFIFKQEQDEYKRENIEWQSITFKDNQGCLDLLEKKMGVLSMLDEECRFPNGTDQTFVEKLHKANEKDEYYMKPRLKANEAFGINHYAGPVEYKVSGFLNKNKDAVPELFQTLMQHSADGFLRTLFDGPDELPQGAGPGGGPGGPGGEKGAAGMKKGAPPKGKVPGKGTLRVKSGAGAPLTEDGAAGDVPAGAPPPPQAAKADRVNSTPQQVRKAMDTLRARRSSSSGTIGKKPGESSPGATVKKSLGAQFKESLIALYTVISSTNPHYVRCIKPNSVFKAQVFDKQMVEDQLRYAGMLETIRIRKAGYPNRRPYQEFCDYFMLIDPSKRVKGDFKKSTQQLLKSLAPRIPEGQWTSGDTKVFFKDVAFHELMEIRKVASIRYAIKIQALWRMFVVKKVYRRQQWAAKVFQAMCRMRRQRKLYQKQLESAKLIQAFARMHRARKLYKAERGKIVKAQAIYRTRLAKERAGKIVNQAVRLQAVCRMLVRRGKFRRFRRGIHAVLRCSRGKLARLQLKDILAQLGAEEKAKMEAAEKARQEKERVEAEAKKRAEDEQDAQAAAARAAEKGNIEEQKRKDEEAEKARERAEEEKRKEEERQKAMAEQAAKLEALGLAGDINALKAAIAATGGAEEGEETLLDADGEVIGAARSAGLGSGGGNWGDMVQNMPEGDDEDETDLGPDGLPKLSLLLPKDVNNLPDPLTEPPPPLPVLQLNLVAGDSSSESDDYAVGEYVEALNYMDFEWGKAVINDKTPHGSFILTFQADGIQQETYPDSMRPIPGGKKGAKAKTKTVAQAGLSLEVGDAVEAQFYEDFGWYHGHVRAKISNTKYLIAWDDYDGEQETETDAIRLPDTVKRDYKTGEACEAQYLEDLLWYAAKVEFADPVARRYVVIFTEYGNQQECTLAQIRPPSQVDVVSASGYNVGDSIWAMWDEDQKWYLAQVSEKLPDGKYRVTFTEYGNEQVCSTDMMRAGVDKAAGAAAKGGVAPAESGVKVVARFNTSAQDGPKKKYRIEIPQATMPGDIANYKMPNFAKQYFRQPGKGNARKDQELQYAKKTITSSLLPLSDELSKRAVEIFGKILMYTSKKPPVKPEAIVEFILTEALVEEKLRDEIFCQLIKQQLGMLPSEQYLIKVWELFTFLCACVRPSGNLENYVLNHARVSAFDKSSPEQVKQFAKEASSLLLRAKALDTNRKFVPTEQFELQRISAHAPIVIAICFPGGNQKKLLIDSASTIGEAINAVSDKLEILDCSPYAIYKVIGNIERVLNINDNICDVVASIDALGRSMDSKLKYRFVFKKRIILQGESVEASSETNILFPQAREDIMAGKIPVTEDKACELAGLVLQHDLGDWGPNRHITTEVERYIPPNVVRRSMKSATDWDVKVMEEYKALQGRSKPDVISAFMNEVRSLPDFGLTVYSCKYHQCTRKALKLTTSLNLGVGRRGVKVLHPETGDVLLDAPFFRLTDWKLNATDNTVSISVAGLPDEGMEKKNIFDLVVQTAYADEICNLINDYAQALLERSQVGLASESHDSKTPDMLSFALNDIILITQKNTDGWFRGEFKGKSGFLPAKSVTMLFEYPKPGQDVFSKKVLLSKYQAVVASSVPSGNVMGLQQYAAVHFTEKRPAGFKFTTVPIASSLHTFKQITDTIYSTEMFVRVMKWMGDYPVGTTVLFTSIVDILQKLIVAHSEQGTNQPGLIDELYCQIWKQTIENPNPESVKKGWELMAILSGLAKPADGLLEPLLDHLTAVGQTGDAVGHLAKFIIKNLTTQHVQRKFAPSIKEITAISQGQPIPLTISFPIAETVIHITPHTTVAEATEIVIRELGIQKATGFGLVAGIMEGAEGPLEPDEIVCDIISQWGRTTGNKKLFARPDILQLPLNKLDAFQPVLSFRKIFFDEAITEGDLRDDPKLFEFLFYQTFMLIKTGELILTDEQTIAVGAFWAKINALRTGGAIKIDRVLLSKCFPFAYVNTFMDKQQPAIQAKYDSLGSSVDEQGAMRQFFLAAAQSPLFGHIMYNVRLDNNAVKLCLSRETIKVVDMNARKILFNWTYSEIAQVVSSPSNIKLTYGNLMRQDECVFTTYLGQQIKSVYERYAKKFM